MNAALKAKWVAALRSGEYKQAQGLLHRRLDDSYCCLGVLCILEGRDLKSGFSDTNSNYDYLESLLTYNVTRDLTVLNDRDQRPFRAIADWIDANIPSEEGAQ